MSLVRVYSSGWGVGEKLTSAQQNALDVNVTNALDKRSGQTDTIQSIVSCAGGGRIIPTIASGPDANTTFTMAGGNSVVICGTLTASRSYTLSASGAVAGDTVTVLNSTNFRVTVIDGVSSGILVRLGAASADAQGSSAVFVYDGSNWRVLDSSTLNATTPTSFTASGTFVAPTWCSAVLLGGCGGGGGGGGGATGLNNGGTGLSRSSCGGGGGGAAEFFYYVVAVTGGSSYAVTVAAGGAGGSAGGNGSDGADSSFGSLASWRGAQGGVGNPLTMSTSATFLFAAGGKRSRYAASGVGTGYDMATSDWAVRTYYAPGNGEGGCGMDYRISNPTVACAGGSTPSSIGGVGGTTSSAGFYAGGGPGGGGGGGYYGQGGAGGAGGGGNTIAAGAAGVVGQAPNIDNTGAGGGGGGGGGAGNGGGGSGAGGGAGAKGFVFAYPLR